MNRAFCSLLATALLLLQLPVFADSKDSDRSGKMTPQTRLAIMRDLNAERVFVRTVFPRGEKGLELKNGKLTPNDEKVSDMVAQNGFAAKPGDRVVITDVIVNDKSIMLEINGGPKKKSKWYQRLSVGGSGTMVTPAAPKSLEANGSLLTLEFDNYVPEMTGEQVRQMLAPAFDFKALTEAEAYQKTLPPKIQQAIKDHKILVGMDRDMVIYAKGRPPKKVRDKDEQGFDYEEWIYGEPPEEVEFVRFAGPVVAQLKIMKVDGEKIVRTEKEVDLPSQETEVAQKKDEPKPANAPTLRRPGEEVEGPQGGGVLTPQGQPVPQGTTGDAPIGGGPPNMLAGVH
jgi:hypothetical protein